MFVDPAAARLAGYLDVVAPPMFAAVYSLPAIQQMLADERFADTRARMLHAAQTFVWGAPVVAGHRVTTSATVARVDEREAATFFTFNTRTWREDGQEVVRGEWLTAVRAR
jgi:acyl dehydratase